METSDLPGEIWLAIPEYEGLYESSNLGRIRRVKAGQGARNLFRPMKSGISYRDGYPRVSLCKNGKARQRYVHQLVAACFLGPCPEGQEVNHIDGDKLNARSANLEYTTPSENIKHSYSQNLAPKGSQRSYAKLTEADVLQMRQLYASGALRHIDLANRFGVCRRSVGDIVNRKYWTHI